MDDPNWPETWPFTEQDFSRFDPSSDTVFYDSPRFVTHIDDGAISALTKWVLLGMHAFTPFCQPMQGVGLELHGWLQVLPAVIPAS